VVLETGETIKSSSLPDEVLGIPEGSGVSSLEFSGHPIDLEETLDNYEKNMLLGALNESEGMINKAAKLLNLSFRSMRYRVKKHNLKGKNDGGE